MVLCDANGIRVDRVGNFDGKHSFVQINPCKIRSLLEK